MIVSPGGRLRGARPSSLGGGRSSAGHHGRVTTPRPTLVYDGACAFCRASVERLRRRGLLEGVDARPAQSFEGEAAQHLRRAGSGNALIVLDADDRTHAGIDGIARLYELAGRTTKAAWMRFPPIRLLLGFGYRVVAQQRMLISRLLGR